MRFFIYLFFLLVISGCGSNFHSEAPDQIQTPEDPFTSLPPDIDLKNSDCTTARNIFKDEIHPALVDSCFRCHGRDRTPMFAVRDEKVSLSRVLPIINFRDPSASLLIKQASNGHCNSEECRGEKPELLNSTISFVDEILLCRDRQPDSKNDGDPDTPQPPQIDFDYPQEYFLAEVAPQLENRCQKCHGRQKYWRDSVFSGALSFFLKAPQYFKGNDQERYEKAKQYLALEKETFYAAPLFAAALFPHFRNGTCNDSPGIPSLEQSPCREIKIWWELEKVVLEELQTGF